MNRSCSPGANSEVLRLHVASGRVWYGHDGFCAEDSGLPISRFIAQSHGLGLSLDMARHIRLFGIRANADLICRLHERRVVRKLKQKIELVSPGLLSRQRDLDDPLASLRCLWQPGSDQMVCGGWHDMTLWDFTTYSVLVSLNEERDGRVPEKASRSLPYHPCWPALSFLPSFGVASAVKLIGEIVDPRWFRHPFRPHRINRLLDYLGVTPANMRALASDGQPARNASRAALVLGTWFSADLADDPTAPKNFLWRTLASVKDRAAGLLIACRRFVRFLYEVWLSEASGKSREGGFVPKQFFKLASEWQAYEAHRRTLR